MGARRRMPEKRTYLISHSWTEDVFKLAGLLLDFAFAIHGEAVGEQALGEAMAANDADGAFTPPIGEFDDETAIAERRSSGLERIMARIDEGLMVMGLRWVRARSDQSESDHFFNSDADGQSAVDFHVLEFGDLVIFCECPELFEDFIKLLVVSHGENFAGGDLAMVQFDTAVSKAGNDRVVRDHHDGSALLMQLPQQAQDDFFIDGVEIPSGLVGKNNLRIIDEGAGDADALLLSAG